MFCIPKSQDTHFLVIASARQEPSFLPSLLLLRVLQHLLHDLLLLDQERPHNPIPDTVAAS